MSRSRIFSLLTVSLAVLVTVLLSCTPSQGNGLPPATSLGPGQGDIDPSLLPDYLNTGIADYDLLAGYLNESDSAYRALEAFKWQGLDTLGFWEVQTAGVACRTYDRVFAQDEPAGVFAADAKWIALLTMVPSPDRVKTVGKSLGFCMEAASKIRPAAYYSQLLASGSYDDTKNRQDWLALCKGLDSSLKSALYLASTMDKTCNFSTVTDSFQQASSDTRDKYLGKFQDQSKQFSALLSALIDKLTKAESAAGRLAGNDQ